jgi:hypothetical protein
MKTILVAPIHSQVSLITNSSSELFVCSKKGTVNSIKKIVKNIYKTFLDAQADSDKHHYPPLSHLWTDVFSEPKVQEYTFEWWMIPKELREKVEEFETYMFSRRGSGYVSYGDEDRSERYKDLKEKETEEIAKKFPGARNKYDVKDYSKACEVVDEVWKDWYRDHHDAEFELFLYVMKEQNGINEPKDLEIVYSLTDYGRWHIKTKNKKVQEFFNLFENNLAWGIEAKKGDIIIETQSDNSAPYEIFGAIEGMLNARRYHLG